jgi:two-component system sensor histidine kinase HydH
MSDPGKQAELYPAHPRLRASLIATSILLISLAHYSTDTQHHLYHDVYRRLYYLPIFMGALWFGLKGGLGASLLCSVLYAPHVLFQWKDLPSLELEKYLEILLFNIVGAVTGLLAGWLNRQRNLYRKTSEELEKAYEELEHRTSRLSLVERQLRSAEKVSALGELSATVAHEFMNPLGSIKGAVEILKDEVDKDHEKHTFLEILIKEIDRLDRTIRSVLRFRSQERLSRKTCHPNELIETILILTESEARQRGIQVSRQLSAEVRSMRLDSDKIQQVLLNVIINAIQAMPEGGRLTVRSEWRQSPPDGMEAEGGEEQEGVLITAEDTGVGIPGDAIEKIFESSYTTKEEGTGLGLTIVRKIVRAHGGELTLESTPGAGTRVGIWLPGSGTQETGGSRLQS